MSETKTLFTSDLHFDHGNIIKFCNRPWTKEEQEEKLIETWNSQVGAMDIVYHLGDFMFGGRNKFDRLYSIINQLNGIIHFIKGNHDDHRLWDLVEEANIRHIAWIKDYAEVRVNNQLITLNHYPQRTWNKKMYGAWHLYGHVHGTMEDFDRSMDVGIDAHPEFKLFTFDEIKEKMDAVELRKEF